ncbi:hypothetical protein SAMN05216490_0058 [Mucilaginibacter mallensis]|uniref:Uncharacterized protein n=1 Tax=Mucilaginibacter mallensis TaxID=652787 RepID=A0A1H1ME58_MUCMA|nr:hypothetical protein SAMN05216490_0058 [Mucilaginibacter mallensis]
MNQGLWDWMDLQDLYNRASLRGKKQSPTVQSEFVDLNVY